MMKTPRNRPRGRARRVGGLAGALVLAAVALAVPVTGADEARSTSGDSQEQAGSPTDYIIRLPKVRGCC